MSKYCGKCDLCDWISDYSDEKIKASNFFLHLNDRDYKLEVNSKKDAIKYYPYLVSIGGSSDGHSTVIIGSEPYIDIEEKEFLGWELNAAIKYWRKCKRNKKEFDKDECLKYVTSWPDDATKKIVERVAKDGDKATFEGIYRPLQNHYRKEWYECMVENGYTEIEAFRWVFGYWLATEEERQKILDFIE